MQEIHPCTGCEYFGKPYWSVVSPCSSCPRIHIIRDYITTTTVIINTSKPDISINTYAPMED